MSAFWTGAIFGLWIGAAIGLFAFAPFAGRRKPRP